MEKTKLGDLSKKAVKGALSLTFRRVALQVISFATINLVLARFLPVSTLGIFNIGAAIIAFFSFFSDIGLSAAIIQKKEDVIQEDLKTTFTIQLVLVLLLVIIIFIVAPVFAVYYGLSDSGMWLIRALALSFLITSLKVIPSVLLERELKFSPLVTVEVLETLAFNILLIVLVFQNKDIWAFSIASVVRSTIGVVLIYILAPWKVRLGFSKEAARSLLSFGIPFQINSLLALAKDRLVPLVIAGIVGPIGIGYITWAQNLAFIPLEVMNIIIRVSFPTFSRLQSDEHGLRKALERSLFLTAIFLYPVLFGMLALAPSLVEHVVSKKWQPALPAFYLFSISTFWATLSTTFTNTLNAIGKIKETLKLMVLWTILTWILTPILTIYFGFLGVAISSAIISLTSILTIVLIKKYISVSILENIWQPFLASSLMGLSVFIISKLFVKDILTLILMVILGGLTYLTLLYIFSRDKLKLNLKEAKNVFSKN
ncbi:MAG: Polysaccharide biosynthesis protein [Microgenomates group bacterium Gr01-1014_93]|nr:MAG: Polysaccharide biosynthesis protein [Microgenomates group bacterium Gr01-1014_93]